MTKEKVNFSSLVLEVTRRCNMSCDHCLRGDAMDMDVDYNVIDGILDQADTIEHITFTGGEPSLNIKAITYFREQASLKRVNVNSFYVVTNGKENALELASEFLLFNAFCIENSGYDYISGLALSKDIYHDRIGFVNETILRGLSFFREDKIYAYNNPRSIVNEGRAYENRIGGRTEKVDSISYDDSYERLFVEDMVYVNVNGDIIPGCDFSYETQEGIKIGNILLEDISTIIRRQGKQEEAA